MSVELISPAKLNATEQLMQCAQTSVMIAISGGASFLAMFLPSGSAMFLVMLHAMVLAMLLAMFLAMLLVTFLAMLLAMLLPSGSALFLVMLLSTCHASCHGPCAASCHAFLPCFLPLFLAMFLPSGSAAIFFEIGAGVRERAHVWKDVIHFKPFFMPMRASDTWWLFRGMLDSNVPLYLQPSFSFGHKFDGAWDQTQHPIRPLPSYSGPAQDSPSAMYTPDRRGEHCADSGLIERLWGESPAGFQSSKLNCEQICSINPHCQFYFLEELSGPLKLFRHLQEKVLICQFFF